MTIYRKGNYKIGFKYFKNNKIITDISLLDYIKSIKIPPAYNDVIIFENNKKILAYGFDSKNRKQVIYNPIFVEKKNKEKYKRYIRLCKDINLIKKKINEDLLDNNNLKNKQIAIIIFLILNCGFRIGNDIYLKNNNSYGLTTLERRHLKFKKPDEIIIEFNGKKNVINKSICKSKIIYNYLIKKKNKLFDVSSIDVNNYLKTINETITSKDLRTWNANQLFINYMKDKNMKVNNAIKLVSEKLHNTPSVCKKNYIFI